MSLVGQTSIFKVLRETDISFTLTHPDYPESEFFLHKNECLGQTFKKGDLVSAFIYIDENKRIAATLAQPILKKGETGFLKVVEVIKNLGIFLDNGISKHVLMAHEYLPFDFNLWPNVGDLKLITLKATSSQIKGILKKDVLVNIDIKDCNLFDEFQGIVSHYEKDTFYITDPETLKSVKIMKNNYLEKPKIGEKITAKITYCGLATTQGKIKFNYDELQNIKKIEVLRFLQSDLKNRNIDNLNADYIYKKLSMSNRFFKKIISLLKFQKFIDIVKNDIIILERKLTDAEIRIENKANIEKEKNKILKKEFIDRKETQRKNSLNKKNNFDKLEVKKEFKEVKNNNFQTYHNSKNNAVFDLEKEIKLYLESDRTINKTRSRKTTMKSKDKRRKI